MIERTDARHEKGPMREHRADAKTKEGINMLLDTPPRVKRDHSIDPKVLDHVIGMLRAYAVHRNPGQAAFDLTMRLQLMTIFDLCDRLTYGRAIAEAFDLLPLDISMAIVELREAVAA